MTRADVSIRPMQMADIVFADEVRALAGWNQTEADWRGYLRFEPDGCFIAEIAGQPAGTATTIRYEGDKVAWIGMVLVHPEQRRHGVGSTLLRTAIAYLRDRGVRSIKLDATPMGKTVYVPLGFVDEYDLTRFEGVAPATPPIKTGTTLEPFGEGGADEVAALDHEAFGVARHNVIQSLAGRVPLLCFLARDAARAVTGYLIARRGRNAVQLGPWVARDAATAEQLLDASLAQVPGDRVFVDVPHPNAAALAAIQARGFVAQRGFSRMYLGTNANPGRPELVYGTGGAEKG